ncbi:DUF6603 domain-containing protein [Ancylobacter sp.]|uniref:DUF6603 domain-containing protein n=1 Tax=Ancylobacter sp. TaxID=1872567 RepID=UPI003BAB7653
MAGGNEGVKADNVLPLSKIDPERFEALGLTDHGCAQLDLWLAALGESGGAVSALQFELPVYAEGGARTTATRVVVASREPREVWRPGDAYSDLKPAKAVIDKALALRAAQLSYCSHDFAAPAASTASAADIALITATARALLPDWPHQLAPLRAGMNFTGEATLLPEVDAALRKRFGLDGSVRVAGSVGRLPQAGQQAQGYRIEASTALDVPPLELLGGRLSVALQRARVAAEGVGTGAGGDAPFALGLSGAISLDQQRLAASIELNLASRELNLIADAPELLKAGALVRSLVPELDAALSGALGTVDKVVPGLRRLDVTTPLDGFDGARLALWLTYAEPFVLFDLIRVTPSLFATGTYGGGAFAFEAEITGTGTIGSGAQAMRFETSLSLPEGTFRAALAEGSPLVLPGEIAGKLDKVAGRENLHLIDLALSANTRDGAYSFSIITLGFLDIPIGSGLLSIGDVRFEVGKRRGEGYTAQLEASLVIGDVEAEVAIDIDKGVQGKVTVPVLPIGAIAADLLQIEAPGELAAVELSAFELKLKLSESTEFEFSAGSEEFTIGGLALKLAQLEVSYAGALTLKGKGRVRFDTGTVELTLDYLAGSWNFTFGGDTDVDLGRALAPLAQDIGFDPPFADRSVKVTRVAGALRLGAEGPRFAVNFQFKINDGDFRLTLVAGRAAGGKAGWDYSLKLGPATIDFRSLPVVGQAIGAAADAFAKSGAKKAIGVDALRVGVLSTLEEKALTDLFKGLPPTDYPPPEAPTGKLMLTGTLQLLDYKKPILYPQPKDKAPAKDAKDSKGAKADTKGGAKAEVEILPPVPAKVDTATKAGGTPAAPPADKPADDMHWLSVQRDCGPLHLAKLGLGLRQAGGSYEVSAGLAGKITVAGVQLELMDAGISVRLNELTAPRGRLKGMSLSFRRGAVSVEGGFLQMSETVYGGQLSVQLPKVSIGVVGVYGTYKLPDNRGSSTSLFIYGTASLTGGAGIKLGAITLTGLALGFGLNRRVIVPAIGEVAAFPLVALAMQEKADGAKYSAMEMLTTLERHLPFTEGQIFAALGLRFTIAETIEAFALAIGQFGRDVEFSLLGLARFEKSVGDQKFCRVELAIKMTLRPEEGVFLLQAELTANSWVLDPSCRLTGGFALGVWFGGARKGDFVLTLGGYHRDFTPPPHYPVVPRLGLNWAVTNELTLKGELYCALTPSHLMAGGRFEASFIHSRIKAWFVAAVDFLIRWAPLQYSLEAGISIRVEADLWLFSINLSLDVQLSLWGPPFAGRVRVRLSVLSFEIAFGGDRAAAEIRGWAQFGALFLDKASPHWDALPKPGATVEAPAICGVALAGGRLSQPDDRPPGGPWMVRGDELVLSVTSVLPATTIVIGAVQGAVPKKEREARNLALATPLALETITARHGAASEAFGIVPLAVTRAESALTIAIVRDLADDVTKAVDLAGWQAEPERQGMPAALWDRQPPGDAPAARMTGAYLAGLARFAPPEGRRQGEGTRVEIARYRESDRIFRAAAAAEPAIRTAARAGEAHVPAHDPAERGPRTFRAPPMHRSWLQGA